MFVSSSPFDVHPHFNISEIAIEKRGICCQGEQWSSDESLLAIRGKFLSWLGLPLQLILVELQCHREGEVLFLPLLGLQNLTLEAGSFEVCCIVVDIHHQATEIVDVKVDCASWVNWNVDYEISSYSERDVILQSDLVWYKMLSWRLER